MPKRKGLGRDIEKSMAVMGELNEKLVAFMDMPLKKGLRGIKIGDEKVCKAVNDAVAKALDLRNQIDDLKDCIKNLHTESKNSRFASRVVANFLQAQS